MAVEIFLKITGQKQGFIQGESTDTAHPNEIVGLSFSWGEQIPYDVATGMATGKRQHSPLGFRMTTNKASPLLLNALVNNENLTSIILTCRKPGTSASGKTTAATDNLVYTLTNGNLIKYNTVGNEQTAAATAAAATANPGLVCELAFTFQKISMSYKPVSATGTVGGALIGTDDWTAAVT